MLEKYLIHIDGSGRHFLEAFYLCHILNNEKEEIEFNIICPSSLAFDYSNLCPFELNIYFYDENQLTTMPKAHKFAYNLHEVFNIDVFIDFRDTATSAFLGTAFKAEKKIGAYSRIRGLLLTDAIRMDEEKSFFDEVLKILSLSFDLESAQKEFEILGDEVLVFKANVNQEDLRQIATHTEIHKVEDEIKKVSNDLSEGFERIQYVITDDKNSMGIFQYLNKVIVTADKEIESNDSQDIISIKDLIGDLEESD